MGELMTISTFLPGEIVKNTSRKPKDAEIGVLIKRCVTHEDYWNVLIADDVVTWFEPNIERFQEKDGKDRRRISN